MADDSVQAGSTAEAQLPPPPVPPAPSASDAALARYQSRMRRGRTVYYAVVAVIVAAVGTWVGVTWSRGEVSHATLHTVARAPASLAVSPPSSDPREAWRTSDRVALGTPQFGGTVITYSAHTVRGRDARTGSQTWSYTRTDRTVCTAAQLSQGGAESGTTIAVYAVHGNCDELSAFDTATGKRRWTRTLDMDGMPVNGRPSFQATPSTLVVATHAVIYAIDPGTGYNRWTYQRFGCRIGRVVLGSAGALISQSCSDLVQCQNVKFCGHGPQLLLRDGVNGRDDNGKPNADKIIWNRIGDSGVPVSADDVLTAADPSSAQLRVLGADKGQQTQIVHLASPATQLDQAVAIQSKPAEVIWIGGQTYALRQDASTAQWHTATLSPPTVVAAGDATTPELPTARITVPTADGAGILDGNDGALIHDYALQPAPPAGSLVYPLGTGFLVTSSAGIVAYR